MASQVLLAQASAAQTAGGCTAPLPVAQGISTLAVNINVTALSGTSPTLTVFVEGQDANGVWYSLWAPSVINATGDTSTSIGPNCVTAVIVPPAIRFRWLVGGSATPTVTFSASIVGRDQP